MAVSLKVEERATRPRSIRNKLRHEGKVPAVVNGYKIESTPISIDEREFSKLLREMVRILFSPLKLAVKR